MRQTEAPPAPSDDKEAKKKDRVQCECGAMVLPKNLAQHKKTTQKHKEWVEAQGLSQPQLSPVKKVKPEPPRVEDKYEEPELPKLTGNEVIDKLNKLLFLVEEQQKSIDEVQDVVEALGKMSGLDIGSDTEEEVVHEETDEY